eukprot:TRINITY_DN3188_c2_g2_i4.p1 TRINITY_DN3188_c2_g2~~TRINITY_DN3188_c2_g2_i4.p1  ORF type:complete len:107 (+),score=38.81 TRINITY_DN3188_c2_g2_i4:43-363(+)
MQDVQRAILYSALILQDEGLPITPEAISSILTAAKISFEAYLPKIYAGVLANLDLKELIAGAASAGPSTSAVAASSGPAETTAAAEAEEEEEEEEEESSDFGIGFL